MHKLTELDKDSLTATCVICGPTEVRRTTNGRKTNGELKVRYRCSTPVRQMENNYNQRRPRTPWKLYKKDHCEKCGFVAKHPVQLDVDHIDGNKNNNDPSNYMTLCANCHRLKTFVCQDGGWWSVHRSRQAG